MRLRNLLVALSFVVVALTSLPAAVSPAGADASDSWVLLSSDRDGQLRTYSMRTDGSRLTPLLPSNHALDVADVTPDGNTIAYQGGFVSRADGTNLRRLARGEIDESALSPNGKLLAFIKDLKLWIVGTDGHGLRQLGAADEDLAWSPDGKALALVACKDDCDEGAALAVQPLRGKRRVLARGYLNDDATWSPSGRWIAYTRGGGDDLWIVHPDGTARRRLTRGTDVGWFDWSPDGRSLAYVADVCRLHFLTLGGTPRKISSDVCGQPAWSRDGKRLAFPVVTKTGPVQDIALADADGGNITRLGLAVTSASGMQPVWSPDGRSIAFTANTHSVNGEPDQIWVVGSDGSGLHRLTNEGNNTLVGWTLLAPVLPPAADIPPTEQVVAADSVATRTPVSTLAADGTRVAFAAQATPTDCAHVALWTAGEQSLRRVPARLPAPCGNGALSGLTLAGSRVVWLVGCRLWSAAFADPLALLLAEPDEDAYCDSSDDRYHAHGHGELLVFNDGPRLVRVGVGSQGCQASGPMVCTTLRSGADSGPVDSVSGGLIAVRRPGAVTVLDQQGKVLRSFAFVPNDAYVARLDGGRLVVARYFKLELESYDVATGVPGVSRPLPFGFELVDVDGGVAVLQSLNTIMLLRLGDGRSFTFTPGAAPVLADLEPAGLYYSHATAEGGGRVVFMPRAEVSRRLDAS